MVELILYIITTLFVGITFRCSTRETKKDLIQKVKIALKIYGFTGLKYMGEDVISYIGFIKKLKVFISIRFPFTNFIITN